ncbi:hypothetical protein AGR1C_pTi0087 [Agrobacterium fabacearum TT111]|nr:hypothetical protein AGR1C_pTi0087 [Agrobacterium fabacearum TT111]
MRSTNVIYDAIEDGIFELELGSLLVDIVV